ARAAWTRCLFLLGFGDLRARERSDSQLRLGFFLAAPEPLLGLLLGLTFGFVFVPPAIVLFALARLGGFALGALDRVAHLTDVRLLLGDPALLSVLSTSPEGFAGAAVAEWPRPEGAPDRLLWVGTGAAGAGGGGGSTLALPAGARVFTFSTSTCLVRPWLKFWRTTLCS